MTNEEINKFLADASKLSIILKKEGRVELSKRVLAFASKYAEFWLALLKKEQEAFNKETTLDHVSI